MLMRQEVKKGQLKTAQQNTIVLSSKVTSWIHGQINWIFTAKSYHLVSCKIKSETENCQ